MDQGYNASSSALTGEYEVFMSFRGEDTRKSFTAYLYADLVDASIRTFRDDDKLRIGEVISDGLLKAIRESKISIPIFSKNYASSKWCLRELAQMVKCHTDEGQMIYPIFYDVTPYEVRHQSGSYKDAFCLHEKNFDEMTVKGWKDAMRKVGELKGLELIKETNGYEGELVKKVVRHVMLVLQKNYTNLPDNLVGLDHHVEAMKELLNLNSSGIRVVGILGMGGLGKTTIAKFVHNQLCDGFEGCCFLEDVRANSKRRNGLVDLQKQLLSNILNREVDSIDNVDKGIRKIKDLIGTKKVLIVLDDVDDKDQFDKLVGKCCRFGAGSRIIVTTRNKKVLDRLEATYQIENMQDVYGTYEPWLMNSNDSLKLFSRHAFMRDFPPEDYCSLAWKVVSSAGGLPLVLETIGSLLFGKKDKDLWEETLMKLKEIPDKKVMERLRISYDALDDRQQQIFLDIACFFVGEYYINPCYMWEACQFFPRDGLHALVRSSMLKIDDNELRMHDQLRDLGRQIVRQESISKPGKRSRLWNREEALALWARDKLTKKVEALNLDIYPDSNCSRERLVGENFGKLSDLRFLKLGWANLDGDFKRQFSNLRWLEWRCSGKFWPTNCELEKLVILNLSHSDITDHWKGWSEIEMAKELKVLNLNDCPGLRRTPVLLKFSSLEKLTLRSCYLLEEIDSPIRNLTNLRVLDLSYCKNLSTFDCTALSNLEYLDLSKCVSLSRLDGLEQAESLRYLDMSNCWVLKIRLDVSKFKRIEKLDICGCGKLIEIQGLDRLESFEYLDMSSCESIERLPGLSNLKMLKELNLFYCNKLLEVDGLEVLESLEDLNMFGCENIIRLPDLSNLAKLKNLDLNSCEKLLAVDGLRDLVSLESLDLSYCTSLEENLDLSNLKKLKRLIIFGLDDLTEIKGLEELTSLELLDIGYCRSIEKLPNLSNLKNIKEINVASCKRLLAVEGLRDLVSLESLDLSDCTSLEENPDLSKLKNLKQLRICGFDDLTEIRGLEELTSLELLDISSCKLIEKLPNLSNLKNIKEILACCCERLTEIKGLEELESLTMLDISCCKSLENLPDLPNARIVLDNGNWL